LIFEHHLGVGLPNLVQHLRFEPYSLRNACIGDLGGFHSA
jgi:hypothetical protein